MKQIILNVKPKLWRCLLYCALKDMNGMHIIDAYDASSERSVLVDNIKRYENSITLTLLEEEAALSDEDQSSGEVGYAPVEIGIFPDTGSVRIMRNGLMVRHHHQVSLRELVSLLQSESAIPDLAGSQGWT